MAPKEVTWDNVDLTSEEEIVALFPFYAREKYRLFKETRKPQSKNVNIELFDLTVPLHPNEYLLKNAQLEIMANTRSAVYGANGTGKTTLFHDMATCSIRDFPTHLHVHHMEELHTTEQPITVFDTVLNAHPMRVVLVKFEAKLTAALATETDEAKAALLKTNLDMIQREMKSIDGYTAEKRIQGMLRVLGFDEKGEQRLVNDLSGGLRMRTALACAFFINPDLLLLDEPTNHLDFPSVLWLENRLRGYKSAFLVVTHDRELLENCTNSVLCIQDKSLNYYKCNFKEFEKQKAIADKKKFDEIEKFLKKNKNVDFSTPLGKEKAEKQAWSEKYYARQVQLQGKFTFPKPILLEGQTVTLLEGQTENPEDSSVASDISLIDLKDVTFSYNPQLPNPIYIFEKPVSFDVRTSTRCGVMGPNGAGKSTILKLLTGKLTPTTGTVTTHPSYKLAYFGQHSTAELNAELTPMEFMIEQFPGEKTASLRSHLSKTGIANGRESTRVKSLNYSERSCVIFAKLTYVCPHLLIMDEPTNFLDLDSVDSLISACNKFGGALLLVSHNRQFLKKCTKNYLSIVPGKFDFYNNLKDAENATYSFIAEMEAGGDIDLKSAITSFADTNKAHQLTQGLEDGAPAAPIDGKTYVFGSNEAGPKKPAAKKPVAAADAAPAIVWKVGDDCKAVYAAEKKWYKAKIVKVIDANTYSVCFPEYGKETYTVKSTHVKEAK